MRSLMLSAILFGASAFPALAQQVASIEPVAALPSLSLAPNEERNAQYEFFIGRIRIADINVGAVFDSQSYAASSSVATRGILELLVKGRAESTVQGIRDPYGRLAPNLFFSDYSTRSIDQTMTIGYQGSAPASIEYVPPSPPEAHAAPAMQRFGTLDPLTAGVIAALPPVGSELCNRTIPVFDGTRRFDLIFLPPDPERFDRQAKPPQSNQPLVRCLGVYERIAGFEAETMADGKYFPFDIWFEQSPIDGAYRAIHFAGRTKLGYAIGKLAGR